MKVQSLGHVVLTVSDRARAEKFYNGILGLPVVARRDYRKGRMTFFSLGNHHDFAVVEFSGEVAERPGKSVGLHHVAFKIGEDLAALRRAKLHLEGAGLKVDPRDHAVTKSLYVKDPDGNGVELYVDVSDEWRRNPHLITEVERLEL